MNLMSKNKKADFINTGNWSKKAISEAKLFGTTNVIASSEDKNFTYIPENFKISEDADYVHITSNNTLEGTRFSELPGYRFYSACCRYVQRNYVGRN